LIMCSLLYVAEFSVKTSPPQAKELFLNSKAVIECVISGDVKKEVEGATVSWTVGGRTQTSGITHGGVRQTGSSFTKTSTLTITESVWFSGDEVNCCASSGLKTTSEKIRVIKGATRPSITIYKPDKSVNDSETVSLVCEASSSDSADVYIMWKKNGGQYLEGNGMITMEKNDRTQIVLSTLTVTGQQYNSAEFACAVKDANTQNDIQPRIFPPAKANSAPTIRLVEFGQSIMCVIEDFYPKILRIRWKKDDRDVRGLDWKTTKKESGLYRTVSVLEENLASSSSGTTYTCEVTHAGKPYSAHLSSKAEFSVKTSPPQAKELFLNSKAVIECVISGDDKKEVEGATVSWTVGGRTQTSGVTHGGVKQTGSSFTKTSTLTITESVWFSGDEVMCSTSSGLKTTSDKISVRKGATRPSITIYKPDKSVNDSDTVSLVCEVSSSDLRDVYIMWKENYGQYLDGNGMTIIKQGRTLIVLSYLTVTGQQYNSSIFTCLVKDANMENDTQPAQISTSKKGGEDRVPEPSSPQPPEEVEPLMCLPDQTGSVVAPAAALICLSFMALMFHVWAEFSLKASPPQAKELFLNSKAVIKCVVSGDVKKEVEGATVSWTVGGRTRTSGITRGGVEQRGSAFTKTSTFTITESVWFSGYEVMCSASSGLKTTSEKIRVRKGATRPSITIYKPDKSVSDSDTVSLVCEVSSSDLQDVYIMWQENGGQYMEGNSMTTMVKNDRTQIVLSTLTVTGQKYNSAEFACAVKDANTQNDIQPRIFPPPKGKVLSHVHPKITSQACANELADVFTSIFNLSLRQCTVPTCYKTTTVVPLPKKNPPSCLNDYRPVALTPIIMKCFERVVLSHIQSSIPNTTDPLQYAYRSNRSTSDAIAAALHVSLSHLENKDSYVRILFIDYSSAFNTVVPHRLTYKLSSLGLHPTLCDWLLSFLTGRPQSVRIGNRTSAIITTNIGTPQGCVLSPILYTLFTYDCVATHPGNIILKFADDTAVIGRITGGDEAAYRRRWTVWWHGVPKQPNPQHGQDQGDDSGHEKGEETSSATIYPGP
ncbi:hypothetical protein NFI96_026967, partial [Prochilodus magdalenae]